MEGQLRVSPSHASVGPRLVTAVPPRVLQRRLRDATDVKHHHLERLLDAPARCGDAPRYRELMLWLAAVHGPIEARLEDLDARLDDDLDTRRRRKTHWLRADIAGLGVDGHRDTPWCDRVHRAVSRILPRTAPDAVGVQYVVEGSMLGGRVLADIAGRRLGISAPTDGRFLNGYGADTGRMWRDYWRHGGARLRTVDDVGTAERSAAATFDAVTTAAAALAGADQIRRG